MAGLSFLQVSILVLGPGALAAVWALFLYADVNGAASKLAINKVFREKDEKTKEWKTLDFDRDHCQSSATFISRTIASSAKEFLRAEYGYMAVFILVFSAVLILCIGSGSSWKKALFVTIAFVFGSVTSILCGYIGMYVAVIANVKTAIAAFNSPEQDLSAAFRVAFEGGGVMGFGLVSCGLINLYILIVVYRIFFPDALGDDIEATKFMYECIAGYGLGGSSIALFGRVGGGIYTKAADVGADMCKNQTDPDTGTMLGEDDPNNPATIADNVGDNVGDVAGMGADLFGSFAESACATMVISASSPDLHNNFGVMCFPLSVAACGLVVCFVTSLFVLYFFTPTTKTEVPVSLKNQLIISTTLMTPVAFALCWFTFPSSFMVSDIPGVQANNVFACLCLGLWSGLGIGITTEYYTSNTFAPTKELARASIHDSATNIIYGLALGYKSVVLPVIFLALTILVSFSMCGMYGVACGALGMLSTLSIGLTIDAYGPICDNAGGIAEMSEMPSSVRDDKTDPLDAAGNTTAAIGKGFAIGSAAMVSLALFGAFVTVKNPAGNATVDVLDPFVFGGLMVGSMLPYWFSAMTMKSVAVAAGEMYQEVQRQILQNHLLNKAHEDYSPPEYAKCVNIATTASLNEMIAPGALVMLTPLFVGYAFGAKCLAGVLTGTLCSGVQMAISASNSGGAWDNAKKYVESGDLTLDMVDFQRRQAVEFKKKWGVLHKDGYGKGTSTHNASITGDTVGDPMKDTSGPAINILVKLSAIISLVFASSMPAWDGSGYLQKLAGY